MKKFKFKRKANYLKIFIFIIILVLFTLFSFFKLNKSYNNLIKIITTNFNEDNNVLIFTNNLDYLINTYSFNEINELYQDNNST